MKLYARQFSRWAVIEFLFSDLPSGTFVPMVELPLGAIGIAGFVLVETASNAGTTDVLDVGTAAAPNAYLNDGNFKSAAKHPFTALPTGPSVGATSAIGITRTAVGTAATAGKGTLVVEYVIKGVSDEVQD